MIRSLSLAALSLLSVLLTACDVPDKDPQVEFAVYPENADGIAALNTKDLQGHLVVVNYWADWCKPCIKELPELNSFYQAYQQDTWVLGVNFDGLQGQELAGLIEKFSISFPVLLNDPAGYYGFPEITGLPVTAIINKEGRLVEWLEGPQDRQSLEKMREQYGQ